MSHMSAIPFLDRPSDTNTSQIADVGSLRLFKHDTAGMQMYRMVFNNSGGNLVAGRVVAFASGSAVNAILAPAASPTAKVAGVTVSLIPNQSYGWVCCAGVVSVTSGNAVAADALVSALGAGANAGRVDDVAVSTIEHCQIGVALAAAGGAGVAINVRLQGLM
jgi:hypothetical protein